MIGKNRALIGVNTAPIWAGFDSDLSLPFWFLRFSGMNISLSYDLNHTERSLWLEVISVAVIGFCKFMGLCFCDSWGKVSGASSFMDLSSGWRNSLQDLTCLDLFSFSFFLFYYKGIMCVHCTMFRVSKKKKRCWLQGVSHDYCKTNMSNIFSFRVEAQNSFVQ